MIKLQRVFMVNPFTKFPAEATVFSWKVKTAN